jgi:hypothetical protein
VDVVEPDLGAAVATGAGGFAPVCTPAATLGDAPDLLHVHVHEFTWAVAFVAHRGGLAGADQLAGERVEFAQVGQLMAAQDP